MDIRETIARLTAVPGVSGQEQTIAAAAARLLRPYCDTVRTLPLHSVLGERRAAADDAPRLLLDAHLDQIGFAVSGYAGEADCGFLHFIPCGHFDPRVLPGKEVLIHTVSPDAGGEPLRGVVACLPPHLRDAAGDKGDVVLEELVIDTGLPRARAEALIPVGTPVTVAGELFDLAGGCVAGAALDDRACFAAILYALELLRDEPLSVHLLILGSAREESGGIGAQTAVCDARPDYAVAVDVTHGTSPDAPPAGTFALGSGAVIGMGPHLHRRLTRRLRDLAAAQSIPHALEILESRTGTNASPMQIARGGVATGLVSVPLHYMHTAVELCRLSDVEATGRLLAALVRSFEGGAPLC